MPLTPTILFSDDCLLAIDKPAGMPSVATAGGDPCTVAAWLLARFPEQARVGERGREEAGLVQRLDNDTSGILLAARTAEAYEDLRRQFGEGRIEKEYTALVVGDPPNEGVIESPIAHHPRKKKKMVVCSSDQEARDRKARPARTVWRVMERFDLCDGTLRRTPYALLVVTIATGVRHQIRAHLASIGFPIAGDRLYQNAKARMMDALEAPRQLLHASRIAFVHPARKTAEGCTSPLPEDFQAALAILCKRSAQ